MPGRLQNGLSKPKAGLPDAPRSASPWLSSLVASLALVVCLWKAGQAERKPVAFGLLGGVTATSLWGKDIHEPDARIWITAGPSLAFHLPAFLGIEADLLYVGKSASYKKRVTIEGVTADKVNKVTAQVLELPLMLKVTAPTESEVQPVIYGGWSFGYWVSKDFSSEIIGTDNGGIVTSITQAPEIAKSDLPDWEQSLVVGGGVEWGLGTFQLRFSLGQHSMDGSGNLDIKTLVTTLMAGFVF
jgi:hypothetical protein